MYNRKALLVVISLAAAMVTGRSDAVQNNHDKNEEQCRDHFASKDIVIQGCTAIKLQPDNGTLFWYRGLIRQSQGDHNGANQRF